MKCLFLCRRLAGYFYSCIQELVEASPQIEVLVVAYPKADNAPFAFEPHERISVISRNERSNEDLFGLLVNQVFDYIYVAGWGDKTYLKICNHLKGSTPITMGMDNQWKGLWRQYCLTYILRWKIHAICDRIWIPGLFQYEYARRLGFDRDDIDIGLYSADPEKFSREGQTSCENTNKYILFAGNMWQDKGVVELVEAFNEVQEEYEDWKLILVGGGPLVERFKNQNKAIEVMGFVQPEVLSEIMSRASAFCLPSYHDAWAVVIHEAACMGLPIIASDVCGAVAAFVHEGYNGFQCKAKSKESLKLALIKLMRLSDKERSVYGERSLKLASQLTPNLWVSKIFERIKKE